MENEFECYRCGQRMSASPELIGTEAACPSCNEPFIVPGPESPTEDPAAGPVEEAIAAGDRGVAELAELVERVRSLGHEVPLPTSMTPESLQWHLSSLDEFLCEHNDFIETINQLGRGGEIVAAPSNEELFAAGELLLARVLAGEWGGTPDEAKALLWQVAPHVLKE